MFLMHEKIKIIKISQIIFKTTLSFELTEKKTKKGTQVCRVAELHSTSKSNGRNQLTGRSADCLFFLSMPVSEDA
jgi:hypothetical protein